jgi:hypothetical protein
LRRANTPQRIRELHTPRRLRFASVQLRTNDMPGEYIVNYFDDRGVNLLVDSNLVRRYKVQ